MEAGSMSFSGAQRVLVGIPEILDMILFQVDDATLLTSAQRVCKAWRGAVSTSPALQQRLFFAPRPSAPGRTRRVKNPFLKKAFPAFYTTGLNNTASVEDVLLGLEWPPSPSPRRKRGGKKKKPTTTDGEDAAAGRRRLTALLRAGASWRSMLVEQPAIFKIGYIENRGRSQQSYYYAVHDVPAGVTMGALYDLAYSQILGLRPYGGFAVHWRTKSNDPPLTAYSYKCGSEEVALSKMEADVKVVVVANLAGGDAPSKATRKGLLRTMYMPKEFKFCPLELEYSNAQDWFG